MRLLLCVFILLLSFQATAQEITISEPLKLGNLDKDVTVLGSLGNQILVSASSSRYNDEIFILSYAEDDLELLEQSELSLEFKKPQVEKIYVRNDTVYVFYSAYADKKLSLILSMYTTNFSVPLFTKIVAPLSKRKFVSDDVQLSFENSNDWSHIVILKSKIVNDQLLVNEYFVLEDFTTLVNGGLIEMDFQLRPAHFLVNNLGEFFLIYSEGAQGFLDGRDLHSSFLVEHYYKDALRPKEIAINYNKRKISGNYFKIDDLNNMLVGSGFYTDRKSRILEGYFMYRYDYLAEKQETFHFRSFSEGQSAKLNSIVSTVFKGKVPNNLVVSDLILRRDGGLVLSGESVRVTENMGSRNLDLPGTTSQNFTFYNDEILVLNISPEARVDWAELVVKQQISRDDQISQSSFFMMNATESLKYFYNQSIGRNSDLRISDISYEGKKKSKNIFSNKEKKLIPMPKDAFQIKKDEVIIPAIAYTGSFFSSGNSLSIIKLKFE